MQTDKLSLAWSNSTLLETALVSLAPIHFREKILVHRPGDDFAQELALHYGFLPIPNRDHKAGIHSSIRRGILACRPRKYPYYIALADQPFLSTAHHQALLAAYNSKIKLLAPCFQGVRGNPAILSHEFREEILAEKDCDRGCAYLFARYPDQSMLIDFGDAAYVRDLDTPEDLACVK